MRHGDVIFKVLGHEGPEHKFTLKEKALVIEKIEDLQLAGNKW